MATFRLHEHIIANAGSLYLTSEPVKGSLLEMLAGQKKLIEANRRNEMVSVLILERILSVLFHLSQFYAEDIDESE